MHNTFFYNELIKKIRRFKFNYFINRPEYKKKVTPFGMAFRTAILAYFSLAQVQIMSNYIGRSEYLSININVCVQFSKKKIQFNPFDAIMIQR